MKKLLLTLFAVSLTFALTACGNKDTEEEKNPNKENNTSEVETNDNNESSANEPSGETIQLYSDDTKMVFKRDKTQLVFYYSGDEITAYHAYADYETAAAANFALSLIEKDDTIDKVYTKGRYLVIEYAKSEYENLKTSEVRALYSYMEQIKND